MNARLPDRLTSRALLIGVSHFTDADLHDLPAVANNVPALVDVLTDPNVGGFDRAGCRIVTDPATPQQVGNVLDDVVNDALDTLVMYYAGHGLLSRRGEAYLAATATDSNPQRVRYSGVPMEWLRAALADSPARNRILILDCCFSGQAAEAMSGAASAIIGGLDIHGTYTLASAPAYSSAIAPIGAQFTAFTGELLGLLQNGVPGGGPLLTLGDLFPELTRALLTRGMPRPQHLGTGLADRIALARNVAYRPASQQLGGRRPHRERALNTGEAPSRGSCRP